jgi:hypothetical protein
MRYWALLGLELLVAGLALYIVYEQRQNERLKRLRPPNTVLSSAGQDPRLVAFAAGKTLDAGAGVRHR